jgi:hypothetical protein
MHIFQSWLTLNKYSIRTVIQLMTVLLCIFGSNALANSNSWQALGSVSVQQNNNIRILNSNTEEFGSYNYIRPITVETPSKYKLIFQYRTALSQPENASFALSTIWYGFDGKELKGKGSHKPLRPATNGFSPQLNLIEVPANAARLELRFQTQGTTKGKFARSHIELKDLYLLTYSQSQESLALLSKPLTKSDEVKLWPKNGLRGLNTFTIGPTVGNSQDPGDYISDATFKKMADWNVNLLRLWVNVDTDSRWNVKLGETVPPIPIDNSMAPYKQHLDGIRIALHLAEKYHIAVVITAGDIVGRRIDVMYKSSDGGGYDQELIKIWKYIASEFGKHPNVIGYDLLNEPNSKDEMKRWQKEILPSLVTEIRAVDKNTYIVVEPGPFALPWGFNNFQPINDPKLVYSFHHYMPHTFTHQGIGDYTSSEYANRPYPGMLKRFQNDALIMWDKRELERSMESAATFAKKHNAIMFVGEFSAIRWAPGAAQWISDSIEIFEKYGWSWAFHSYRAWNGWNPTFVADEPASNDSDGGKVTDSMKVLLDYWKKNTR